MGRPRGGRAPDAPSGAQVLSYLRATGLELGLLINFNVRVLKDGVRRLIHSRVREP